MNATTTSKTTTKASAPVKGGRPRVADAITGKTPGGIALPQGKGKPAYLLPTAKATEARKDIRAALAAQAAADQKYGEAGKAYAAALVAVGAVTSEGTWNAGFTVPILALAKALSPNPKRHAYPSGGAKTDAMPETEREYIDNVQRVNAGLTRAATKAKGTEGAGKGTGTGSKGGKSKGGGANKGTAPQMPPATVATIGKVIDTVAAKGTKAATDRMAKSVAAWLSQMATTHSVGNMSADAAALLLASAKAYVNSCDPASVKAEAKAS